MWNILTAYLYETGTYLGVSGRNIPQVKQGKSVLFSYLARFELRTENLRPGAPRRLPQDGRDTLAGSEMLWNPSSM